MPFSDVWFTWGKLCCINVGKLPQRPGAVGCLENDFWLAL